MKSASLLLAQGAAKTKLKEVKVGLGLAIAAGAAALFAALFLLAALTLALARQFGAIEACLIMAGLFALLCAFILYRRHRRLKKVKRVQEMNRAALLGALTPVGKAGGLGVPLAALAAGFLFSRKG